jgi:DNA adenine methylase
MLSNADVSLVRKNFTHEKYNITAILCKRSINSKNPEAKTNEVIIKNY